MMVFTLPNECIDFTAGRQSINLSLCRQMIFQTAVALIPPIFQSQVMAVLILNNVCDLRFVVILGRLTSSF